MEYFILPTHRLCEQASAGPHGDPLSDARTALLAIFRILLAANPSDKCACGGYTKTRHLSDGQRTDLPGTSRAVRAFFLERNSNILMKKSGTHGAKL